MCPDKKIILQRDGIYIKLSLYSEPVSSEEYLSTSPEDGLKVLCSRTQVENLLHIRLYKKADCTVINTREKEPEVKSEKLYTDTVELTSGYFKNLLLSILDLSEPVPQFLQSSYIDIIFYNLEKNHESFLQTKKVSPKKVDTFTKLQNYIDWNIKQSISIESLSQISHMSERSLYYLFKDIESTTPHLYIKKRKILHAYQDLRRSSPDRTVTQVAMEYGFSNLGRFAQIYRQQIGELPSETLTKSGLLA
mgnify:CR=1 FL=1